MTCTPGTGGNPNECTAVGDFSNTFSSPHGSQTLVFQGTEGSGGWTFSHVASPNPGQTNSVLEAVRCPTYDSCIAVGSAQTFFQPSGNFSGAMALQGTQSGGTWTWSTLSTDSTGGALTGVDCTSASSCMAVGSQGSPQQSLVETWNGSGGFTPVSSPNPGGYGTDFSGISCVSASNCSTVGYTTPTQGALNTPLVMQWDGSQWPVTAPSSGNNSAQLQSVACDVLSNTCTGAGSDGGDALIDFGPGFGAAASGTGPQGGGTAQAGGGSGSLSGGGPSPPKSSSAPAGKTTSVSPTLTISSASPNRALHGVVVALKSHHGTLSGVDVYLYRRNAVVAHIRLAKVTARGARVILKVNGKLPPPGHYVVRAKKGGRQLAARGVAIAGAAAVRRPPPRFTG